MFYGINRSSLTIEEFTDVSVLVRVADEEIDVPAEVAEFVLEKTNIAERFSLFTSKSSAVRALRRYIKSDIESGYYYKTPDDAVRDKFTTICAMYYNDIKRLKKKICDLQNKLNSEGVEV